LGSLTLLLIGGLALPVATAAAGQTLADVARKEDDRRKRGAEPTKVYTNKDLTPVPAGSAPAAPEASAKAGSEAVKDVKDGADKATTDTEPVKNEAYWSGRLKTLKDKLERDTSFADALQTKVNSLNTDLVNRDDPAQRAVIERDRQKAVGQLAGVRKDVEADKKAIADLQEEARRSGVPPGWLR
jgi:hypothetical protein